MHYQEAIDALQKASDLQHKLMSWDAFFLAMAHWQLGHKEQGRTYYNQAVMWMANNQPRSAVLRDYRAEAEALMGPPPATSAPTSQPR